MSDTQEQARTREERRRHALRRAAATTAGLAGFVAALGLVLALDGTAAEQRIGYTAAAVAVFVALAAGGLAWRWRDTPVAWREAGGWRDRVQRDRRAHLLMLPVLMLTAVALGVPAVADIVADRGEFGDWVWAGAIVLHAVLGPAVMMGWDGGARKQKRLLDDELTRALRQQAMTLAFLVLLGGVVVVFGVGLWRPGLAVTVIPLAMFAAAAAGIWRFVWLDRRAEDLG